MKSFANDRIEVLFSAEWIEAVPVSEPTAAYGIFTAVDRKLSAKWHLHTSWEGLVWRWKEP